MGAITLFLHDSGYLDGLGDAYEQGLVKAVGVSNYSGCNLTSRVTYDAVCCASYLFSVKLISRTLFL